MKKIKKDIYIIKNTINDKVYIGQAVDSKKRFQGHCKPSAAIRNNSIIDRTIQKQGKVNFYYELLENQIKDYNEKEIYWIKKYNSITPNGYNILNGGDEPPVFKGCEHYKSVLNSKQVEELTEDLKNTKLSFINLAKRYNFKTSASICEFNKGQTYTRSISYPIREEALIGKLNKSQIDEIIKILKTSYRSYSDIALDYNVEYKAIMRINKGLFHKREEENYPIREGRIGSATLKFTYEQITEINKLLLETNLSLREISRKFNVEYRDILNIKNGAVKLYRRKDLTYPLRSNN